MSAFICNDENFHYLLAAWRTRRVNRIEPHRLDLETQAIGQMLVDANYASVNTRYRDNEQPEPYTYDTRYDAMALDPMQVIKAAHCLGYQSCEFDGWDKSDARRFLLELVWTYSQECPGWDAAQWGAPSVTAS